MQAVDIVTPVVLEDKKLTETVMSADSHFFNRPLVMELGVDTTAEEHGTENYNAVEAAPAPS